MTSKRETEELIERYCLGQLTPEELRIFEQWIENDPEMSVAVEQHRIITDAFQVYGTRTTLKEKLAHIHNEMENDNYRFTSPLKVVETEKTSIRVLWKRYRMVGIAAMIALFAVSTILLTFDIAGVGANKSQHAYQELRREVESIKRSQKAIIKGINSENKEATDVADPSRTFTGTGIAISNDGYILTSYHVVEDARSIYITNQKFDQVRVKPVYTDKTLDLAVLKVDDGDFNGFGELPYSFKRSIADPGEKVFTLGYPREDLIFGEGSISSYTGFEGDTSSYQISIPVNPGNSGGPLFDGQGNLLGIISGRNSSAEGASFAVKSRWITDYIKGRSDEAPINIASHKNLKGLDRTAQIKKLKDFVFMVKVYN